MLFVSSYLEIYNEKVRDLLGEYAADENNSGSKTLKVREHPKKGPYVQGKNIIGLMVYSSQVVHL